MSNCLTNSPQIVHTQLIHPQIPIFTIQTRSCPITFGFTGAASIARGAELYSSIISVVVGGGGGGGVVGGGRIVGPVATATGGAGNVDGGQCWRL